VISWSNGSATRVFDAKPGTIAHSAVNAVKLQADQVIPSSFNAFENKFLSIPIEVTGEPGRVRMRICQAWSGEPGEGNSCDTTLFSVPAGGSPGVPFQAGLHTWIFDGRRDDGTLFDPATDDPNGGSQGVYFLRPSKMKPTAIFVKNSAPVVPGLAIKSNPCLVRHSYDQVTRIEYCLDQAATVTIKVLKPGHFDPGEPAGVAAVLASGINKSAVACATPHTAEWYAQTSEIAGDGVYTFTIEATPQGASAPKALHRGAIQVRR
jgi:hypothetical protein